MSLRDLGLGLVALGVTTAIPTSAAGAPKVASAPVSIEGKAAAGIGKRLQRALADGLGPDGVISIDARCDSPACYRKQAGKANVDYVVSARVDVEVTDYELVLEAFDARGRLRQTAKFACEICSPEDVAKKLTAEASALRGTLPDDGVPNDANAAAMVVISSKPSGATVAIDGANVGTTPFDDAVAPGSHAVVLSRKGFSPAKFEFVATKAERSTFAIQLESRTKGKDRRRPGGARVAAGGALIGIGVGTLVAGVVLLAIDDRPVTSRCSGEDRDINGECARLYDTVAGGAALSAIGGAILITGVALVATGIKKRKGAVNRRRAQKRKRARIARRHALEFRPHGLGLVGRF